MVHPQEKERSGEGEARREILHELVKFRRRAVPCRQLQTLSTRRIRGSQRISGTIIELWQVEHVGL